VVTGAITRRDIIAQQKAVERGPQKVLAHCRSGTRSYLLWMASRALFDNESALKLVAEAAIKGYDLRVLPSLIEKLQTEAAK
jgi:sulfide:quinone oxidoreductase